MTRPVALMALAALLTSGCGEDHSGPPFSVVLAFYLETDELTLHEGDAQSPPGANVWSVRRDYPSFAASRGDTIEVIMETPQGFRYDYDYVVGFCQRWHCIEGDCAYGTHLFYEEMQLRVLAPFYILEPDEGYTCFTCDGDEWGLETCFDRG